MNSVHIITQTVRFLLSTAKSSLSLGIKYASQHSCLRPKLALLNLGHSDQYILLI